MESKISQTIEQGIRGKQLIAAKTLKKDSLKAKDFVIGEFCIGNQCKKFKLSPEAYSKFKDFCEKEHQDKISKGKNINEFIVMRTSLYYTFGKVKPCPEAYKKEGQPGKWFIQFESINELLQFVRKYDQVILQQDCDDPNFRE